MNIRVRLMALALCLSMAAGCKPSNHPKRVGLDSGKVEREGEPDVFNVSDNDPDMKAAVDKARKSVDHFIRHLAKPGDGDSDFSIKAVFTDGSNTEFMWVTDVTHADGVFSGVVNNNPNHLKNVKFGDSITVPKEEIADWMFVENGVLRGGYSIRVLRKRLNPKERKEFDSSTGLKITKKILPDA